MYVGVDYYPEHWPRERWTTDLDLMQEAGFNVVRMAEFDWANIEPHEGAFDFAMWDEVLDLCAARDLSVVLCTPTASMPAWVARKYPESMGVGIEGKRKTWGLRRDNCFSAEKFRQLANRVTRAMADHFRDHSAVIGWQPDNELGHPFCYCDRCRVSFQDWLRRRYETVDRLNAAWGTRFWGHQIREWVDIVIPDNNRRHNPGSLLDWRRHFTWQVASFLNDQVAILKGATDRWFVTHNFMEFGFHEVDYFELAKQLDFVSWDNYPTKSDQGIRSRASMTADLMRGFKGKNFWITEQTAGATGVFTIGRNTRPGELRNIAYQQVAHGADAQIWFRWRTCTFGREQYWSGLLGHDGRPLRRYREAAQTGKELHRLWEQLEGTTVRTPVAMIFDYDSDFATRILAGYHNNNYPDSLQRYYDAFFRAGINVDFVQKTADFSKYKLVVAANLHVLPDPVAHALNTYVEEGGVLLTDCRTAVRREDNQCHARTLPGLLSPMLGIEIEEYEGLQAVKYPVVFDDGTQYAAVSYVDWAMPRGAKPLARFDVPYLRDFAAVTRNPFGAGAGYYIAAVVEQPAFYDRVIAMLLDEVGHQPVVRPAAGVEVSIRKGKTRSVLFLINHTDEARTVTVPSGRCRLLGGGRTGDTIELNAFDVEAIEL